MNQIITPSRSHQLKLLNLSQLRQLPFIQSVVLDHPLVSHSFRCRQPFLRLGYELFDQIFRILGDNLPLLAFEGVIALLDFGEDLVVVVSVEGGVAA